MPFNTRSRVKMDKKLKMTKIREIDTKSELLNQITRSLCHSFRKKMFSLMQLKYVTIFIRKVLKMDRSAFSGTPSITRFLYTKDSVCTRDLRGKINTKFHTIIEQFLLQYSNYCFSIHAKYPNDAKCLIWHILV